MSSFVNVFTADDMIRPRIICTFYLCIALCFANKILDEKSSFDEIEERALLLCTMHFLCDLIDNFLWIKLELNHFKASE